VKEKKKEPEREGMPGRVKKRECSRALTQFSQRRKTVWANPMVTDIKEKRGKRDLAKSLQRKRSIRQIVEE